MKHIDQTIKSTEGEINAPLASRRLKTWDRFYRVLAMVILIIGLSGLLIMARMTWSNQDHPVSFNTMTFFEIRNISAFVLAPSLTTMLPTVMRTGDGQATDQSTSSNG